jgi:hypothetical protein
VGRLARASAEPFTYARQVDAFERLYARLRTRPDGSKE